MSQPELNLREITIPFATLFKVLLVVLGVVFVAQILDVLAIVFVAIILSTALDPWVDWMQKNHIPRGLAALLIYLGMFTVISLILVLLVPPLIEQLGDLANALPAYYNKLVSSVSSLDGVGNDRFSGALQQVLQSAGAGLAEATSSIFSTLASIFGGIFQFVVTFVMTYYFMVQEGGLKRFIRSLTPQHYQDRVMNSMNAIQVKLGLWLRGQLLLMLIIGVMTYVGLSLFNAFDVVNLRYILVLSLWAGLTEAIPYVGPILGGIPAVLLALSISPLSALFVLLMYVLVQQLENNLIVPLVMKKAVGLNPVVSMAAVLVGSKLGGVVGTLMAIPVATAIAVLISSFWGDKFTPVSTVESEGITGET